jgi:hypothetical protein
MYKIIKDNGQTKLRKLPEMRTQEVMGVYEDYEKKLAAQPLYPTSGMDHLEEGTTLEEKDIEWGYVFDIDEQQARELTNEEKQRYKGAFLKNRKHGKAKTL